MAENQEVPAGMKRALEILTSVLQAANGDYLEKSMLIVPDVEADSDETQKRDALTKLLETLASDDPGLSLSDENIADVKAFFEKLYGGQVKFRHRYSDVCNVVFDYKDCELDPTNVPYPVSRLADNMGKVLTSMLEDRPRSEQADSVRKLCDHIELEKTRLLHYTEQMKMMCSFEERSTQLDEQIKEQQEKTESEIKRLEDDSLKRIEEEKREAQRENVSVLGVFTGIVVAFVAGLTFSSSILQSIDRASIYRLCAMATVIGVFLFDTIAILLSFLGKVTRVECPDLAKIVKIANFIALVFLAAHPLRASCPALRPSRRYRTVQDCPALKAQSPKEDRICLDLIHLKGQLTQARCNPEYLMSKWFLTAKKTFHPAPESDDR